jgi:hypothetical protein
VANQPDNDAFVLDQVKEPVKGDRFLLHNDKTGTWMVVKVMSGMNSEHVLQSNWTISL